MSKFNILATSKAIVEEETSLFLRAEVFYIVVAINLPLLGT